LQAGGAGRPLPVILLAYAGELDSDVADGVAGVCPFPIKPSKLHDELISALDNDETVEPDVQLHQRAPDQSTAETLGQSHPLKILLTEDNLVNQKVAVRLLANMGYSADVAGNGREALTALERRQYDVVLMDVQMPEMDGIQATHEIRRSWKTEEQPRIVAMTAHAMAGDREKCLAEGMDDYISKPVHPEEMRDALLRCRPRRKGMEADVAA